MRLTFLALLLMSAVATAGDFGAAPSYPSTDAAVAVTAANANTATGDLALTVNGVNYAGKVQYVQVAAIGGTTYYTSTPAVLFSLDNTKHITASVMASHWTTRTSSGRGGGYIYQHYAVSGGTVTLP